jgi:speckle-type POZ protein
VDSGSLEFVVDYEQTKDFPIGKAVYSDPFFAGGRDWMFKCWPRGLKEKDNGEYISIYLMLLSTSTTARARFRASVLDRHGKPVSGAAFSLLHVFITTNSKDRGTNSHSRGWPRFAKRVDLEAEYLTEGRITFLCHILVNDNPIPLPPPSKGHHLCKLLDEMDGADVSFTTNGQTFHAHRAVLAARSPVFKAKFFGSGAGATSSNISLDDIEPATFKVLLKFIYTDALPGDDGLGCSPPLEMFHHLFAAAEKYALHRLKLICAQKLWENVSLDSIATTLDFAEMYNCLELKTKCIDFLVADENFNKVVLTEGFLHLGQKFPSLIAELRERVEA